MDTIKNTRSFMRVVHRYLGFFLAGIMVVYAVSGVLLIYRDTDFLKKEKHFDKVVAKNLDEDQLGKELKIRNLHIDKVENGQMHFKQGTYNPTSGEAKYSKKELPFVLNKMTKLHKSESKDPLSPLNLFFAIALFFFVLSSFWMFSPKTKAFKRGMVYMAIGLVLAVILVFL